MALHLVCSQELLLLGVTPLGHLQFFVSDDDGTYTYVWTRVDGEKLVGANFATIVSCYRAFRTCVDEHYSQLH